MAKATRSRAAGDAAAARRGEPVAGGVHRRGAADLGELARRRGPTRRRRRPGRPPRRRRSGSAASCASRRRRRRHGRSTPGRGDRRGRPAAARADRRPRTRRPRIVRRPGEQGGAANRGRRLDRRRRSCRASRAARRPQAAPSRRGGGRGRARCRRSPGAPPGNAMRRSERRSSRDRHGTGAVDRGSSVDADDGPVRDPSRCSSSISPGPIIRNGRRASPRSPARRASPELAEAVIAARTAAGSARRSRAGAPGVVPRPPRPPRRRGRWVDRRRHGDERAVGVRRGAGRRGRPDGRGGAAARRGRRRRSAPCGRPATTPRRPTRWASASCPTSPSSPPRSPRPASGCGSSTSTPITATARRRCSTTTRACCSSAPTSGRCIPGTGRRTETGAGDGDGTTVNVPLPPDTTGDVYLRAFDEVIAPIVDGFAPTWLLISAGFDAHRADPLTDLGLSAGDFAALTARALQHVPAGRTVAMLEGGYDLDALTASTAAVLGVLAGVDGACCGTGDQRRPRRRRRRRRPRPLARGRRALTPAGEPAAGFAPSSRNRVANASSRRAALAS